MMKGKPRVSPFFVLRFVPSSPPWRGWGWVEFHNFRKLFPSLEGSGVGSEGMGRPKERRTKNPFPSRNNSKFTYREFLKTSQEE
jgi:hypothetical protein